MSLIDVLGGEGEVRQRMRSLNWDTTGLGTVKTWSASLRTAVSLCLNARLPVMVFWGTEFTAIFNDSASQLLGSHPPHLALAQPAQQGCAKIWESLAPALQTVLATGQPAESAALVHIDRQDEPEANYLTFFHTPIISETGECSGCFTTISLSGDRGSSDPQLRTSPDLAVLSPEAEAERIAVLAESDCESSESDCEPAVEPEAPLEAPVEPLPVATDHLALERQRAAEMNSLLSAIVDSSDDAIIGFTLNSRIISWNCGAEKMFGYTPDEIQGQLVAVLVPPDRADESLHIFETMQQGDSITHFETVRLHKDGTPIDVSITASPIQTGDDDLIGVSMTLRDMTAVNHNKAVRQQTEIALQRANERFEWAAMAVNCLIYDWDIVHNHMERTEGLTRILGYSLAEATPTAEWWRVLMHPEDVLRVDAEVAASLAIGDRYAVEYRIRNKNNQYIYVLDQGLVAARNADGRPIRQIGSVTDISERHQAEATLRDSETRYRTLSDAVAQLMWINSADGRIQYANSRWQEYMGLQPSLQEEVDWRVIAHPDDIPDLLEARTRGIAQGEAYEIECRLKRYDQLYRWHLSRIVPLKDDQGHVLCWFGTATEIETIKRIEVEQRFLAEVSSVLTTSLDYAATLRSIVRLAVPFLADYCIFDVITAEQQVQRLMWHHRDAEANLDQIQAFAPPLSFKQHPVIQALVYGKASLMANLTTSEIRALAINADHLAVLQDLGSQSWMTVPLITHQRILGALTFCYTAVSGRHYTAADLALAHELAHRAAFALDNAQLYQQAQEANRIKDEFLAILSHELRTPLNPILGWLRLLKTGKLDAGKTAHALDTIERNAQLQADLIEDLLDISRILQGKLTLNVAPVDLREIIAAAQETVRLSAEARAIALQTELEPVDQVAGDAGRLQQVVWNLLSNAIKFTPEQGQVLVRLQKIGSYAQIQVIDTGRGILPEFLPYVFDYFRQADSATTRKFGGLGLGLAIVRHIVELHGGSVLADSAGEGQGATFTVRLPLMSTLPLPNSQKTLSDSSPSLVGRSILIVDDDEDSLEFLSILLEQAGATVTTVSSAHAALAVLEQQRFNLMLSDIGMPEMDGYMLMQTVRSLPPDRGGQMPAIALTAYAGELDQQRATLVGFQQHIAKPLDPNVLLRSISSLLKRGDSL